MAAPYLGLDIGLHRTGIALSESGLIAQPLTTVEWKLPHSQPLVEAIIALINQYEIATIVVGMPLGEEGENTAQALKTAHLLDHLREGIKTAGLTTEVVEVNEFHSTQDALAQFPDVDKDAAAAAVILQDYLEQNGTAW
ncbi:MAG TPA: Holliday junction resolvase RuvX [Verrucomicrobiae bacterium]|nr:Holliday junction resolvase RuvX [Verrucomicrobiae bacterium]